MDPRAEDENKDSAKKQKEFNQREEDRKRRAALHAELMEAVYGDRWKFKRIDGPEEPEDEDKALVSGEGGKYFKNGIYRKGDDNFTLTYKDGKVTVNVEYDEARKEYSHIPTAAELDKQYDRVMNFFKADGISVVEISTRDEKHLRAMLDNAAKYNLAVVFDRKVESLIATLPGDEQKRIYAIRDQLAANQMKNDLLIQSSRNEEFERAAEVITKKLPNETDVEEFDEANPGRDPNKSKEEYYHEKTAEEAIKGPEVDSINSDADTICIDEIEKIAKDAKKAQSALMNVKESIDAAEKLAADPTFDDSSLEYPNKFKERAGITESLKVKFGLGKPAKTRYDRLSDAEKESFNKPVAMIEKVDKAMGEGKENRAQLLSKLEKLQKDIETRQRVWTAQSTKTKDALNKRTIKDARGGKISVAEKNKRVEKLEKAEKKLEESKAMIQQIKQTLVETKKQEDKLPNVLEQRKSEAAQKVTTTPGLKR